MEWHGEFGIEVGTFLTPGFDGLGRKTLQFHVPWSCRGLYRPIDLPDYTGDPADYRIDDEGYVLCEAYNEKKGGICPNRAHNRQDCCQVHGAALHPNDKVPKKRNKMSRTDLLVQGLLKPEELDNEELRRGYCRGPNGGFGRAPRKVPRILRDIMMQEVFRRADEHLENHMFDLSKTVVDIATGTAYEPADRLNAAKWGIERIRGKLPDRVIHTQDKPWEMVMQGIVGGSRADSRLARGLDPETAEPLDVEWTEGHDFSDTPGIVSGDTDRLPGGDSDLHTPEPDDGQMTLWDPVDEEPPLDHSNYVDSISSAANSSPTATLDELEEIVRKARNKRYAARAMGQTTVEEVPFMLKETDLGDGTFRIQFIPPEDYEMPNDALRRVRRQREDG